ncbi:MAG: zinc ABC transporter substrate-binding protein [Clostridia bacterium]|nr:zinc ABC transporter substrate-binding protein [Clostridia bacterium]
MKQKVLAILLSFSLLFALCVSLVGCGEPERWEEDGRIRVLSTVFPSYDFARAIGGEAVDARMLVRPGSNTHSYEPTANDVILIRECDVFIYVGGENDAWVHDLLSAMDTEGMVILSLYDIAETLHEEEHKDGMESDHVHTDECEDEHGHKHDHEAAYDEHVWTSFENAGAILKAIRDALIRQAPELYSTFDENANAYLNALTDIESEYREAVALAQANTLLFGDRFPFLYLTKELGLDYLAAFSGCSSVTEPTVSNLIYLIEQAEKAQIPIILYVETSEHSHKTADLIAAEVGAETRMLHSGHTVSREDYETGITYLDLLRQNLTVIREALNP